MSFNTRLQPAPPMPKYSNCLPTGLAPETCRKYPKIPKLARMCRPVPKSTQIYPNLPKSAAVCKKVQKSAEARKNKSSCKSHLTGPVRQKFLSESSDKLEWSEGPRRFWAERSCEKCLIILTTRTSQLRRSVTVQESAPYAKYSRRYMRRLCGHFLAGGKRRGMHLD